MEWPLSGHHCEFHQNAQIKIGFQIPYSRKQKHFSISDTPMLLIEINSISNMECQKQKLSAIS